MQIDERGIDESGQPGSALHRTGAVYKLAPSTATASNPVGAWNHYVIKANGNTMSVRLNDMPVAELPNGTRRKKGFIALQNHHWDQKCSSETSAFGLEPVTNDSSAEPRWGSRLWIPGANYRWSTAF